MSTIHNLLIETRAADPEMVPPGMVIVTLGPFGPRFYREEDLLPLVCSHFPLLSEMLETQGVVDVPERTPNQFDAFQKALQSIHQDKYTLLCESHSQAILVGLCLSLNGRQRIV